MRSDISVDFPDPITVRGVVMYKVEDAFVDRLVNGDSILGWGGDARLALYLAPQIGQWFLMRYNEDRTYAVVTAKDASSVGADDIVGVLILHLLAHDTRRVDPFAEMLAHNERTRAAADTRLSDWVREEGAPRLAHALLAES